MDTLSAVKVAIVTESFLPQVNGVTNSVCRVLERLEALGHEALVIAPGRGPRSAGATRQGPDCYAGAPVRYVRGVALPFYPSFVLGLPTRRVMSALAEFEPDVVHLASPLVLGTSGAAAARRLDVPSVAVFQTDIAGFARRYGFRGTGSVIWWWLRRLHRRTDRTLAPSTPVLAELEQRGVPRLALWGRGVDRRRFHPDHRSADLRARLAPTGEVLVGYVGRLAAEKRPRMLTRLVGIPGARLVIVGDGPEEERLRRQLPEAVFTGFRTGTELSELIASLDVFVHTGADETFCQAIQEALASGVPVVAPAAGGPLDLVRPGFNGLLYAPDDATEMRAAVNTLVADPVLRRRMAVRAVESVQGRGWAAVCDELIEHYRELTGSMTERRNAADHAREESAA
ncbi:glycosyltransferase family 4 protein [Actinomadura rudentiformis]|uniref:Glycosyltransferase family 1 protein n=1 Tax=Actinomadura rudentiformis TaxID=359158 RepID=A0A6H9YNT4_9ACTN|nr:glycosyltransferase family 1 protein [Actinomadura rudentiformis]KAB2345137.1 glycosyltransferase family 1 protein [Actinomadura rudentiformis]